MLPRQRLAGPIIRPRAASWCEKPRQPRNPKKSAKIENTSKGITKKKIEAEAEELALTDRIFSHNDGESADDVEEKIDEVAEDAPPSDARDEQDTSEDPGSQLAVPFEPQAGVESAILFEDAEPLTSFEARSPSPFSKAEEDDLTDEDGVTPGELASETGASGFPTASEEIEYGGESGEEPSGCFASGPGTGSVPTSYGGA